MPDVNPYQIYSWQAAVIGTSLAVVQAVYLFFKSRREIRWKRVQEGYKMIDSIFSDDDMTDFVTLIDSRRSDYLKEKYPWIADVKDLRAEIHAALRAPLDPSERSHEDIQFLFDSFLYFAAKLEYAIATEWIMQETLEVPCDYYIGRLKEYKEDIEGYARHIRNDRAIKFLNRFPGWRS